MGNNFAVDWPLPTTTLHVGPYEENVNSSQTVEPPKLRQPSADPGLASTKPLIACLRIHYRAATLPYKHQERRLASLVNCV